jgi:hypothetical protein
MNNKKDIRKAILICAKDKHELLFLLGRYNNNNLYTWSDFMGNTLNEFNNHTLGVVIPAELYNETLKTGVDVKGMIECDDYRYVLRVIKIDYNDRIPYMFKRFLNFFKYSKNLMAPTNLFQMQWVTLDQLCNFCLHPYYDIRMNSDLKNAFLNIIKKYNLRLIL